MGKLKSTNDVMREALTGSFCVLMLDYQGSQLMGVALQLGGPIAALPSCNQKDLGRKAVISKKTGKKSIVTIQRKSNRQLGYLSALTRLYRDELVRNQLYPPPTFGDRNVTLQLVASEAGRCGRWDSSNLIKFLSDWLEDVGLVDDDHRVEAHGYKAKDYEREDGITRIYLTDRSITNGLHERCIQAAERRFFGGGTMGGVQS